MSHPPPEFDPQQPNTVLLLWAYSKGIFPMADMATGEIGWYRPNPRAIFPLDTFHVPKSLARVVRSGRFDVRMDTAFEAVIRACAEPRGDHRECWIDERLIEAYTNLHHDGYAHSVEAWRDGQLVGGLYGVHVGGAFCGESMFVRPELGGRDASKVCLVHLVEHLRARGFRLLDTQFRNDHLTQFGCVEISADEYERRLHESFLNAVEW